MPPLRLGRLARQPILRLSFKMPPFPIQYNLRTGGRACQVITGKKARHISISVNSAKGSSTSCEDFYREEKCVDELCKAQCKTNSLENDLKRKTTNFSKAVNDLNKEKEALTQLLERVKELEATRGAKYRLSFDQDSHEAWSNPALPSMYSPAPAPYLSLNLLGFNDEEYMKEGVLEDGEENTENSPATDLDSAKAYANGDGENIKGGDAVNAPE
ncbi:hypothetical protein Acr_07g0017490 [Actinidia rufa]|uniref:Uncharacterized protein n=1 Tax=Actinidia rufa TaxID=165716 RepID=A0A7J0EYV1_9ERIC|nr:hypothetical protein Acr_07g0017490 [Actinidia rufa]